MEGNILLSEDMLSAKLARCFVKIPNSGGGYDRYNLFNMKTLEAKFEKKKTSVPRLGTTINAHKSTGLECTATATMFYNSSIFRRMALDFKNTGKDMYFEVQITNEDPNSNTGRQTVILKNCNLDGGILAKFDITSDDPLEEEVNFTFDDFDMPEEFKEIIGIRM